jgi:hypothetical protein
LSLKGKWIQSKSKMGWGHLRLSQNGLRSPPTKGGVPYTYKVNFSSKYYLINHVNGEIQKLLCGILNNLLVLKIKKHYFVFALVLSMQIFKESNKDWSTIESYLIIASVQLSLKGKWIQSKYNST